MKKLFGTFLLSACLASTSWAQATLTFEGATDGNPIGNYYNGGAGGNLGVTFVGGDAAYSSFGNCTGGAFFALQPSGCAAMLITPLDERIVMNVDNGFINNLSLYYTSPEFTGSVLLYDGFDGTGSLLGTTTLNLTPDGEARRDCGGLEFCPFVQASLGFSGVAKSAVFYGDFESIGFDDVTFTAAGSTPPTTTTPEPATYALMGLGLGAVGIAARRRRTA